MVGIILANTAQLDHRYDFWNRGFPIKVRRIVSLPATRCLIPSSWRTCLVLTSSPRWDARVVTKVPSKGFSVAPDDMAFYESGRACSFGPFVVFL